jgi:hypothetical protein
MAHEPLIAPSDPAPLEPAVHTTDQGATQEAPSEQQQRVADDVFTEEQGQVAAALLAAQTGLGLLHNLMVDTFGQSTEEKIPPRREPPADEDKER